jgi:hypothetical protein
MDELPAGAEKVIALVAGEAVIGAHDASEPFDINAEKLFALVADGWRRRDPDLRAWASG